MSESGERADGGALRPAVVTSAVDPPRRTAPDPTRGRRILILAPFPPQLDGVHGGSRAVAQLVVALSTRNRIALAYLRARDEDAIDQELARHCEVVVTDFRGGSTRSSVRPLTAGGLRSVAPRLLAGLPLWAAGRWSASFDDRVREVVETWHPEVVQAEFSVMGQYLPATARGTARGTARLVATFHEPAAAAAGERARSGGLASPLWRIEARRWRRFEAALLSRVDAAVAFTARDADALRALRPLAARPRIEVIPLGVPLPAEPSAPDGEGDRRILFVGNFTHAPNADAARRLVEEIFPPLRRRFADLELWIVGPGAPSWLVSSAADGVVVSGEVPDVGAHLARATVVVAPLRQGGGMRVKVLEAMAACRAIVATPLAAEGLDVTSGRELILADDAESFVGSVAALLDDPPRRRALGRAARDRVAADHSWDRSAAAYESVYERLLHPSARVATHG